MEVCWLLLFQVPNDKAAKDRFLLHNLVEDVVDGWRGKQVDAAAAEHGDYAAANEDEAKN